MLDRAAYKNGGAVFISKITFRFFISKPIDRAGIMWYI